MLHELFGLVRRVQHTEFRENAHMCAVDTDTSLHEGDEFGKFTAHLVILAHGVELIRLNNDVQTSELRELVLILFNTAEAHFLPRARRVGLLRCVDGSLEQTKLEQSAGEAAPVAERRVQESRRFVQTFVEAPVRNSLLVGTVGRS